MKQEINIIWCKKNLRITDNEILSQIDENIPTLWVFFFEPEIMNLPDYSDFHLKFTLESLFDLQVSFYKLGIPLLLLPYNTIEGFKAIQKEFNILSIFSHEETWNWETFQRDKSVIKYCKKNNISFTEYSTNGVVRRLKSRNNWSNIWWKRMWANIFQAKSIHSKIELPEELQKLSKKTKQKYLEQVKDITSLQKWWETIWKKILSDFLQWPSKEYMYKISKPLESESGCSRLSPYISYWCLSLKYIVHESCKKLEELTEIWTPQAKNHKKSINAFLTRIHWQSHFIQKLEDEPEMEFRNLNRDFDTIRQTADNELIDKVFNSQSWIPYIDATMKQLHTLGRTNFRSRAIIVSFLCNTCMQPWQAIWSRLAQLFTDYEPGIHYPQLQMQAWTTWINTIRIYNPIYNWEQKDPLGKFIFQYLPELKTVPAKYIHSPWNWEWFDTLNYPQPIVDVKEHNKIAKDLLWTTKWNILKSDKQKILEKHASRMISNSKKKKQADKKINKKQTSLF